ncbi:MAG TPA: phage holin family protein [Blastocatellia bacterium]|nr:phage holin family protein [Blastocatellia bacterium]HMX28211.1 phage holin family protein [Blastocatellia bacterium]HMY75745.1 phage holin family protein [Blastocatellia bacterium]HMZ18797.1 phage holin family protein [Blastocatellia bacterium]HNG29836.1 phage holin family protein [Blastocatellia bacterium]
MAWNKDYAQQEQGQQMSWWPGNAQERESLGALLSELATQSASLVRDEVALARQEVAEKMKVFQSAVVVIAIGAVLGLVALLILCAAAVLALAQYIEPWQAALIVGGVFVVIAGITAVVGFGKLKQTSLKPEQTIETLEENKEWLKEIT